MDRNYSTTNNTEHGRGKHLKFEDRCSIKIYHKLNYSNRYIASELNCSPSTIGYELKRGIGVWNGNVGRKPEYSAKRGQTTYEANRSDCHRKSEICAENPFVVWLVDKVKIEKWSIDACVGYARINNLFPEDEIPCAKTIYNAVWAGTISLKPFDLPEAISRCQRNHKSRENKRNYGKTIDERPETASLREDFGHWEIDTVIGHKSGKESVVLTLVEKKSDYYIAIKIPGKNSESVMAAMETLVEEYGEEYFSTVFKTITSDNGSEFEGLSELETYGTQIYFAHPFSSWERAQNERHNRIFRKYIPKGVSFDRYSAERILSYADSMNSLPRKLLNYHTPEELFEAFLDHVYSLLPQKFA